MRIYIDSSTFPATPGLYADAAKTKPLPRMIPAVELQRGGFEVAFVGSNQPQGIASVSLVASIDGAGVQVVAEHGENVSDDSGDAWRFNFALNAESLIAEIAKRGSVRLRVGVIVEDDTERREWQFSTVVYPSASSEETDTEAVESAKNFAELAERAAKRAQEAQADVAGNAQLAENAKQTATQAANAAIGAADNAEVSERNAAESKDAAEKAKTEAEAAKTAAQKAASDAQATLGNVYTKSQIDGVSTGAEVVLKMNEIIAQLKDYEAVTGETLPNEFWVEVMDAFERWQANPTEVKKWSSSVSGGVVSSNSPYYQDPAQKSVVDFSVVTASNEWANASVILAGEKCSGVFLPVAKNVIGVVQNSSSSGRCNLILPVATTINLALSYSDKEFVVYAPKATVAQSTLTRAKKRAKIIAANITDCRFFAQNYDGDRIEFDFPICKSWGSSFSGARNYNQPTNMPCAIGAYSAFVDTAMTPENIAATLDTLPSDPVGNGGDGKIQFSRADKTKLAPLMAESPYKESVDAAVARGWTVQFD